MFKNLIVLSLFFLFVIISCQPPTPTDTTNYYRITVSINPPGAGTVVFEPSSDSYAEGTEVRFTVTPAENTEYFFKEWSGTSALEVINNNRIKATGDKNLIANFELYEPTIPDGVNVKDSAWDNATVYFVVTDRFSNGDASNDTSYGRESATNTAGHFYGGDLKGLTQKINSGYFTDLSIDAIWITSPVEQVHGWVPGGGTAFKHYAYHGYYAMDFTKLDANMGTEQELKSLVNSAHSKGIKIVFDVVMNHPGYSTIIDLNEYSVDVLLFGWENATVANYHSFVDYKDPDWPDWWGPNWIRAGLPGYSTGTGDLQEGLSFLPDFKTESTTTAIGLPIFYANKPDTSADVSDGNTIREYLVKWHTDWVEKYGIDGFRCDTAKHVELDSWKALKTAATAKYNSWKATNPGKSVDNEDFWMTGEVFGQGVSDNDYYDNGFDSLINFGFQNAISVGLTDPVKIDDVYSVYADTINNTANFNSLSYISSHDTYLFFSEVSKGDIAKQKLAGSFLLLSPGAAQIYYGDEYGRTNGTYAVGTDTEQKTRSQMLFNGDAGWTSTNDEVLAHWKILSKFRKKHMCIGSGDHVKLSRINPYKFARIKDADKVVCVIGATGSTEVNVSGIFTDGEVLTDFYTGATATVAGGKATFTADSNGTILIEKN